MRFSRLPLLWRVFGINATLLVIATLLLALTPVTIHAPVAFVEAVSLVVGLIVMLAANLVLLRHTLRPIRRLIAGMRTVDLLRPGQRLVEGGGVEAAELVRAFNQMLERLEVERRESGRRALRAQEAERLRIARGLHDEVGQVLTGILLELDFLASASRRRPPPRGRGHEAGGAPRAGRGSPDRTRAASRDARATGTHKRAYGIVAQVRRAERCRGRAALRRGSAAALRRSGARRLSGRPGEPDQRRAPRPGVSGRSRARAGRRQRRPADRDDGCGMAEPARSNGHGGLRGMRERALLVGGALAVKRGRDGGVEVRLEVPAGQA